jgi:hypothetical protein
MRVEAELNAVKGDEEVKTEGTCGGMSRVDVLRIRG